jgi:hypothetical protein
MAAKEFIALKHKKAADKENSFKKFRAVVFNLIFSILILRIFNLVICNKLVINGRSEYSSPSFNWFAPKLPDYLSTVVTQIVHFRYKNVNQDADASWFLVPAQ